MRFYFVYYRGPAGGDVVFVGDILKSLKFFLSLPYSVSFSFVPPGFYLFCEVDSEVPLDLGSCLSCFRSGRVILYQDSEGVFSSSKLIPCSDWF